MNTNSEGPILLVEDNEDDVFFMRRAFHAADVANPLHVVTDGNQAIHYLLGVGKYANRHMYPWPLLIVLDLKMPIRDGHELLLWMRLRKQFRRLVVIVLTSSSEQRDVLRAYRLGANSYLVKPSSPPELTEQIRALKRYWLGQNLFPRVELNGE